MSITFRAEKEMAGRLRVVQVHQFYEQYLRQFRAARPELGAASWQEQIDAVIADGFAGGHIITPYLPPDRFEGQFILANDEISQRRWRYERGLPAGQPFDAKSAVAQQIALLKPDVLYLTDPVTFESGFIRSLSWRPPVILGWRHAPTPDGLDWSEFTCMLSGNEDGLAYAKNCGAPGVHLYGPGFPEFVANAVNDTPQEWDIVFCGQAGMLHKERNRILNQLVVLALTQGAPLKIGYFIPYEPGLGAAIESVRHEPRWGMDMFRALKSGRIVLNVMVDMAKDAAGNMRYYEATGAGSFLINNKSGETARYFDVGTEVEEFANAPDLFAKCLYFLEHEGEREAIALAGQKACLERFGMKARGREFVSILAPYLQSTD